MKKPAKKKYQRPALKSEKVGTGSLTAGGGATCNGMTGGGKKDTVANACTTLLS
jgi:hypothetical protein